MEADIKGTVIMPGKAPAIGEEVTLQVQVKVVGISMTSEFDEDDAMYDRVFLSLRVTDVLRATDKWYDPREKEGMLQKEIDGLQRKIQQLENWNKRARTINPDSANVPALQRTISLTQADNEQLRKRLTLLTANTPEGA